MQLDLEIEYNLNVIKEITVTDPFLSMDREVRNCEEDETLDECVTSNYINSLEEKCKCLPINLRLNDKVHI